MGNIKVSELPAAEQIKDEDLLYIGEKDTSNGGYRSRKATFGEVKRAIEEDLSLNETNRYSYRYGWPDYERAFVVQFPKNTDTTYTLEEDSLVVIKKGDLYLPDYTNCKTPLSLFGATCGNGVLLKAGTKIRVVDSTTIATGETYHQHIGSWTTNYVTIDYDGYAYIAPLMSSSSNTSTES